MLEAYAWPQSVAPGEPFGAEDLLRPLEGRHRGRARGRRPRGGLPRGRGSRSLQTVPDDAAANGCGWDDTVRSPLPAGARSGYYSITITAGEDRADAFVVVRPGAGEPRADPARALHHHVERVQRLGRTVAVHRRHPRLLRTSAGARVPREARARPPQDAARARPRGAVVLRVGRAARPVGVERRRRLVELGARLRAVGGVQRLRASTSRSHRTWSSTPRSSTAIGCSRASATTSTGRGACATPSTAFVAGGGNAVILSRQHVLLAGPVRGRPPRDDVLQVPRRRGSGGRHRRRAVPVRRLVGPADRPARDLDDRPHVHPRRLLAVRARRAAGLGRVHRAPPRALGVRGDGSALRRRPRPRRHDRRVRGRRRGAHDRRRRPPRPDPRRRRARHASRSSRPRRRDSGRRTNSRPGTRTSPASSRTPPMAVFGDGVARAGAPGHATTTRASGCSPSPGGGTVFNAGVTDWTYGLEDPAVDRITRNVLDRLS